MRFNDKLTLSTEGWFNLQCGLYISLIIGTYMYPSLSLPTLSLSPSLAPIDHKTLNARPTSHDLPNQSHDQLEELTVEMLEQLESEQVSLDQYCSRVITNTAPLLPGYLNRQLTWAASDGEGLPAGPGRGGGHSVATHLAIAMELLSAVVELMDTQRIIHHDKDTLMEVYKIELVYTYMHVHVQCMLAMLMRAGCKIG